MGKQRAPDASARKKDREKGSVSATEAQNNFGALLQRVAGDEVVYITKYDQPTAVVMSPETYWELISKESEHQGSELLDLEGEFDEMLAHMQTAEAASAVDTLFEMDSDELGAAAARAARTRGVARTTRDQ